MSAPRHTHRRQPKLTITLAVWTAAVALLGVSWGVAGAAPADQAFSPAASVVIQLQAAQPTITLLIDYSQSTDTERLLGLRGQYIAKATFNDTAASGDPVQVTGIVEVFASERELAARMRSIVKPAGEQDLESGPVLVRLFGLADPAVLAAYQSAVKQVVLT